ncbi:hypothetical protein AO703_03225 [[Enterobacter] lignolyticus]|uniref:Uncharacterized protein n=2 Tax=[Enterobacter] lignolyticus TaxID=1334193 RepID=A0A806X9V8_9ENTR|nr:hypothetical protein AO703_03225 [[Enterobacter] lignolyticus]
MEEKIKQVNGIDITYRIKPRKYDNRHLIVIFSGFGLERLFTYDFSNALNDVPATIVWIKDDFYSCCSYYLCKKLDFSVEYAIEKFINDLLQELNLTKVQCTLAGFSKGGSAALYFGAKYNYKNIVSTVPQFNIGSYIKNDWPEVARHMLGRVTSKNVLYLDTLLSDIISEDREYEKNIYLLTSPYDSQYITEIKPHLSKFMKYNNFNLFYAESLLIGEHNQVTSYHVPLILGVLNSIAQGAIPKYGYCELKGDPKVGVDNVTISPVALLKRIPLKGTVIYPEGIAVLEGIPCPEYSDIDTKIVFNNGCSEFSFPLAKAHRSILSRTLYNGGYVNYDKGWFCTERYQGLEINSLPAGRYTVFLEISCGGHTKIASLKVESRLSNKSIISNDKIKIYSADDCVYLDVLDS